MRSAPAVTVRCTGGALWRTLLWLLPAVAAAALVYWAALQLGWGSAAGLSLALACATAAAAVAARRRPPPARLSWDGAGWTCNGLPVLPQVMLDTGSAWLLLHLRPPLGGRGRWLAVSQRDAAAAWHALRAAVYCPPPKPSPNGSAPQPP